MKDETSEETLDFPEVPVELMEPERWRKVQSQPWRRADVIHILEARSVV